jgi:hypothetical protein
MKLRHRANDVDLEFRPGNRNVSLWYRSMMQTNSKMDEEKIKKIVFDLHYELSQSFNVAPLNLLEIKRVAKSVCKYNFENKNYICKSAKRRVEHKNSGAMQFDPICGLDENQYLEEVKLRKRLSALRTARIKSKETINRIKDAILRLNFLGLSLTFDNIALYADRSKGTISRYVSKGLVDIDKVIFSACSIRSYTVIAPRLAPLYGVSFLTSFKKISLKNIKAWKIASPP